MTRHQRQWTVRSIGIVAAGVALVAAVAVLPGDGAMASATTTAGGRSPLQPASPVHVNTNGHGRSVTNATQNSLNWAGYAVTGARFTDVTGSWTQPAVTCPKNQAQESAFWVGIDGFSGSDPTVQQVGTDSDCTQGHGKKGGGPNYYAWYELYPQAFVALSSTTYPVAPGDPLSASVSQSGSAYTLSISDGFKWSFSTTQTPSITPLDSSAEWVAEAPTSCAKHCKSVPLADFGSVGFTGASANHQAISAPAFTNYQITMSTKNAKKILAVPSALTSGGTAFTVTWLQN